MLLNGTFDRTNFQAMVTFSWRSAFSFIYLPKTAPKQHCLYIWILNVSCNLSLNNWRRYPSIPLCGCFKQPQACSAQPVEAINLLMKPRMFHLQKSQIWIWISWMDLQYLITVAVRYIQRKVSKTICIKQMKQVFKSLLFYRICDYMLYYLCHVYKF